MKTIFEKRRKYVYDEYEKKRQKNPKMSNRDKSKVMKELWVVAKKKFKQKNDRH